MSAANASLGTAAAAAAAACRAAAACAAAWAEALRIRVARAFLAGWGRLMASARGLGEPAGVSLCTTSLGSSSAGHQTSSASSWTGKKACAECKLRTVHSRPGNAEHSLRYHGPRRLRQHQIAADTASPAGPQCPLCVSSDTISSSPMAPSGAASAWPGPLQSCQSPAAQAPVQPAPGDAAILCHCWVASTCLPPPSAERTPASSDLCWAAHSQASD